MEKISCIVCRRVVVYVSKYLTLSSYRLQQRIAPHIVCNLFRTFSPLRSASLSVDNDSDEDEDEDAAKTGSDDTRSAFLNQVDEILSQCPQSGLQRGLFSATIGPNVQELAADFLSNPVHISIGMTV